MDSQNVDVPDAPIELLPETPQTEGSSDARGCNAVGQDAVGASLVLSLLGFALLGLRRRESQLS